MRVPTTYLKPILDIKSASRKVKPESTGEIYAERQRLAIPNKKLDAWYEAFLRGDVGREIKVSIKCQGGEFDRPCRVKSGVVVSVVQERRGFGL